MTSHPWTPSIIPSRRQRRKLNRVRYGLSFRNPINALHCNAKPGVGGFLNLPREIRNIIYSMVIEDLDSSFGDGRCRTRLEQQGYQTFAVYSTRLPNINTGGLLRTNHQLREETIQAINFQNTNSERGICYRLSLAEYTNCLMPFWLTRPAPPHFIQTVEVNLAMLSLEFSEWTHAWDARVPGRLPQFLLQMLRRFLNYGPRFKPRNADMIRRIEVTKALPLKALTILVEPMAMRYGIDNATGRLSRQQRRRSFINPAHDPMNNAHQNLGRWMAKLAKSGLLYGSVQRLRLQYQDTLQEWDILDTGNQLEAAKELSLLGWGPVLGITQKALHGRQILKYSKRLDCLPLTPKQEEWHKANVNCSAEVCTMPEFAGRPDWQYMYQEG